MSKKVCAISVDLDPIRFYEQIHGIAETATEHLIYSTAIERISDWAREHSVPVTWFVVGRELNSPEVMAKLAALYARGDELANHTEHHHYDLTRRSFDEMQKEVEWVTEKLSNITGETSFGFRAPGYRITNRFVSVLREANVLYDSSLFPCPSYWAAKATILLGQRIFRRQSRAILDNPRVVFGPRLPYRMGKDYLSRGTGLLQLPISVTPKLRLPFIGTSLALMGETAAKAMAYSIAQQPFVNLELHGIDALDKRDGLERLARVQPDLRISWEQKLSTLEAVLSVLKRSQFSFVTLREIRFPSSSIK
jgi:hypothetical protein